MFMTQVSELITQLKDGSVRALARLITTVENNPDAAREVVQAIYADTGRAHVVGITGPPGAGKSSLVTEIGRELRQRNLTIAILAIDPSSPFTGGAILGDRVRMRDLSGDKGVFIRSMASRGNLGGLAKASGAVVKLLDVAGYDLILLETVGAGQAEVDIATQSHTTLVVEAPGMGDDVQSIKAGILEIADILVVNKADKPGASRTAKSLEMMLHLGPTGGTRHHGVIVDTPEVIMKQSADAWQIPVLKTSASNQTGIIKLVDMILAHQIHLKDTGQLEEREQQRHKKEIEQILTERLLAQYLKSGENPKLEKLLSQNTDPYTVVDRLLEAKK
ncbi:MAG: LAO/AO transport system kinase [Cellvibrionaceae bacterium]|jgi:LAO/AO transport system kinase